ncbi:hypothetical protein HL42_1884 [Trichophyton rubrum]|nr:hypothetical protein HL42_1884 [Trichophyton rubrum]
MAHWRTFRRSQVGQRSRRDRLDRVWGLIASRVAGVESRRCFIDGFLVRKSRKSKGEVDDEEDDDDDDDDDDTIMLLVTIDPMAIATSDNVRGCLQRKGKSHFPPSGALLSLGWPCGASRHSYREILKSSTAP